MGGAPKRTMADGHGTYQAWIKRLVRSLDHGRAHASNILVEPSEPNTRNPVIYSTLKRFYVNLCFIIMYFILFCITSSGGLWGGGSERPLVKKASSY